MIQIRKAERKQSKLRIGLSSPSGAGKTYSALLLAKGLCGSWDKVGMIDTETGRGDFYSDLGGYVIATMEAPFTPEKYIEYINALIASGVEVLIVDSISHEWEGKGGCLEINERLAQAKYKGNTWSAWNETTHRHQKFIDAIIQAPVHVITTVRNKVDTVMTDDKKVKKVGTKEITREGFEYELTVNFALDRDTHTAIASKDNTRLFDSRDPFVITEGTGKDLAEWVMGGSVDTTAEEKAAARLAIGELLTGLGKDENWLMQQVGRPISSLSIDGLNKVIVQLTQALEKKTLAAVERARQTEEEGRATPEEEETMGPVERFESQLDAEMKADPVTETV